MNRLFAFCVLAAGVLLFNAVGCCYEARADSSDDEVQSLITKLKSPEAEKRASAASSLGNMGPRAASAIPSLIETLKDTRTVKKQDGNFFTEMYVMFIARDALVQIGDASVEPLIKALLDQNTDSFIRQNIADTLGNLRDPRAIEPLLEVLSHQGNKVWDVHSVMSNTSQSLEQITGQKNVGGNYREWQAWYKKNKPK
jgi:HEAT repeat protein